jgi:hypothetical protein
VRNITANPYSGVHPDDVFDVAPYADAAFKFFLRNPLSQNLPRKFKIAFESTPPGHALTPIHDMAFRRRNSRRRPGVSHLRGRRAGGHAPGGHPAGRLHPRRSVDADHRERWSGCLIGSAIGPRQAARADQVPGQKMGRRRISQEVSSRTRAVLKPPGPDPSIGRFPVTEETAPPVPSGRGRWNRRRRGLSVGKPRTWPPNGRRDTVGPRWSCPWGTLRWAKCAQLADLSRRLNGGRLRTTVEQNFLLRWVRNEHLPTVQRLG